MLIKGRGLILAICGPWVVAILKRLLHCERIWRKNLHAPLAEEICFLPLFEPSKNRIIMWSETGYQKLNRRFNL